MIEYFMLFYICWRAEFLPSGLFLFSFFPVCQTQAIRSTRELTNVHVDQLVTFTILLYSIYSIRISPDYLLSLGNKQVRFYGTWGGERSIFGLLWLCNDTKLIPHLIPSSCLAGNFPILWYLFPSASLATCVSWS